MRDTLNISLCWSGEGAVDRKPHGPARDKTLLTESRVSTAVMTRGAVRVVPSATRRSIPEDLGVSGRRAFPMWILSAHFIRQLQMYDGYRMIFGKGYKTISTQENRVIIANFPT